MRQIKFRAWDGKNMLHEIDVSFQGHAMYDNYEYPTYPLMQFTGLKDKNGVDIYEGDVVQSPNTTAWIIEWDNENACFNGRSLSVVVSPIDNINCLVVGNIHQNPELCQR